MKFYVVAASFVMLCTSSIAQVQVGADIDGEAAGDRSGYSTALSADGSIVAIGANSNQDNGSGAGHVRVFEDVGGVWTQLGGDIDGEPGDQAGQYVSLSANGMIVAIGEPICDVNGSASGQVRVFELLNGAWVQIGNSINGDSFSWQTGAVSLSDDGSILAVGARGGEAPNTGLFTGVVRIYENIAGNWVQIGSDIYGFGAQDIFGRSVSISADGTIVAVGAPGDITNNDTGYVSVFENIAGTWTQIGSNIVGSTDIGEYGYSVSLSADGSIVAAGENLDASGLGRAQVFQNVGGVWTQVGSDIFGEALSDQFGYSIDLSDDGNTIAVGARGNDNNGNNAGRAYVFENLGGNWVQFGNAIDGEALGDITGFSIFLSGDASRVSVGAVLNDGNGSGSGHTRVFEMPTSSLTTNAIETPNFLKAFPNPTNGLVQISSKNQILSYELYNLMGQKIVEEVVNNQHTVQLDLNGLNSGVYFLKIKSNTESATIKLVKE